MPQAVAILFGAAFTVAVAAAAGRLLLGRLALRFYRGERILLEFILGSALLSLLVFLLAACGLARRGVLLVCGVMLLGISVWRARNSIPAEPLPQYPAFWKALFLAAFAVFAAIYLLNAMAPEWSPEGSGRRLPLVVRYMRDHGFGRATPELGDGFPQGLEMLFLFAFAWGKHSAAALVHFAYLLALPLLMLAYARRMGFAKAGVVGAVLTFVSPVVGVDGSSACTQVALASILFAVFYLLQIWDLERRNALLVAAGVAAGFAGAVAYAGMVAAPFALGFVGWKTLRSRQALARPLLTVAACALAMTAPWLAKNWIVAGNPLSPFFNGVFPNSTVTVALERDYLRETSSYPAIRSRLEVPLETTILGKTLGGLTGPLFLLSPLALLALRKRAGRQLLLAAAVFGASYPADIGTRFLIPSLPYISLGMGLALEHARVLAPALVAAHLVLSYPNVVANYCEAGAWRIETTRLLSALRVRSEDRFLTSRLPGYTMARRIDQLVPPGGRVFAVQPFPKVYTSREVLVAWRSLPSQKLAEGLCIALVPARRPTRHRRFRFPAERLRAIRMLAMAAGEGEWTIHELRLFHQGRELPRQPQWRLRARPNPWDVPLAFDNSLVTFWRSAQDYGSGMQVEVELGGRAEVDTALLESSPDQARVPISLQVLPDRGAWKTVFEWTEDTDVLRPAGLRRAAIREFLAQRIEYLLAADSDFLGQDLQAKPDLWGVTEVARSGDLRLYRLR